MHDVPAAPVVPAVRVATPDDEHAILELWIGLLFYHRSIEDVWPRRWTGPREAWPERLREYLRAVWRDPERQAVFVADAGQPAKKVMGALIRPGGRSARIHALPGTRCCTPYAGIEAVLCHIEKRL